MNKAYINRTKQLNHKSAIRIHKFLRAICSVLTVFCISPANAEEYCVPATHTLKYELGSDCNGTTPASQTVLYMGNFTTPNAATVCGNENITKWKIVGTNNYITSNTTLPYVWFSDITLVAGNLLNYADYSIDGISYDYKANNGVDGNCPDCGDGGWIVKFDYADVRGIASCNSVGGNGVWGNLSGSMSPGFGYSAVPDTVNPDLMNTNLTGANCWCRITSFNGETLDVSPWVFRSYYKSGASNCAKDCASGCAGYLYSGKFSVYYQNEASQWRPAFYKASGIVDINE